MSAAGAAAAAAAAASNAAATAAKASASPWGEPLSMTGQVVAVLAVAAAVSVMLALASGGRVVPFFGWLLAGFCGALAALLLLMGPA